MKNGDYEVECGTEEDEKVGNDAGAAAQAWTVEGASDSSGTMGIVVVVEGVPERMSSCSYSRR